MVLLNTIKRSNIDTQLQTFEQIKLGVKNTDYILDWVGDDDWSAIYDNGQTTDGDSTHKIIAGSSARVTKNTAPANQSWGMQKDFVTPVNISGLRDYVLHIRFYHHFPADFSTNEARLIVWLGSGTNAYWYNNNSIYCYIYAGNGQDHSDIDLTVGDGWDVLSLPLTAFSENGNFNPADCRHFAVNFKANYHSALSSTHYLCVDEIWITRKTENTEGVIIMCDDGDDSLATAYNGITPLQMAARRGIRLVLAIIPEQIDKSGYLTSAQLIEAIKMGHQVIVHSQTSMDTKSFEQQCQHIIGQQRALLNWAKRNEVDIENGYKHYIFHGNLHNANSRDATSKLLKTAWPCKQNCSGSVAGQCFPADLHRLHRSAAEGYDASAVQAAIANAVGKYKNVLCLYVHEISSGNPEGKFGHPADFAATLDWINANKFKVLTCSDIINVPDNEQEVGDKIISSASVFEKYANDFFYTSSPAWFPWVAATAINSGTISATISTANHPGVIRINSSTSANSGYRFLLGTVSFLIAGGEKSEIVFMPKTTTNTTVYMGFLDTTSEAAPTDGAWINIAGTTLAGKTASNGSVSTTGTSYTISEDIWYRAKIAINPDATRVDFYLFDENGNLLWTDYLTANIPTGAGRQTGHGLVATNSGTSNEYLIDFDYVDLQIIKLLQR